MSDWLVRLAKATMANEDIHDHYTYLYLYFCSLYQRTMPIMTMQYINVSSIGHVGIEDL